MNNYYSNDDRFFFAGPFLLGALTGGVAVAAFNPNRPPRYGYYMPAPYYYPPRVVYSSYYY